MKSNVRRFYYLDPSGIQSLYNQLAEYTEKGYKEIKQDKKSHNQLGAIKSKITGGIFGISSEATGSENQEYGVISERMMEKGIEQKLVAVEKFLYKHGDLLELDNVKQIVKISPEKLPTFIRGMLPFFTPLKKSTLNVVDEANKNQFIELELDQKGIGDSLWLHILMGCSISKIDGVHKADNGKYYLGQTGHFAIILRAYAKNGGLFGFFGYLQKTGDNLYIKPFAIWV